MSRRTGVVDSTGRALVLLLVMAACLSRPTLVTRAAETAPRPGPAPCHWLGHGVGQTSFRSGTGDYAYVIAVRVERDLVNPGTELPATRQVLLYASNHASFVYGQSWLSPGEWPAEGTSLEVFGYVREGGQCVVNTLNSSNLEPGQEGFIRPTGFCLQADPEVVAIWEQASRPLGCAASPAVPFHRDRVYAPASQRFQRGRMLYLKGAIYVLQDGPGAENGSGGTWSGVRNTFFDPQPETVGLTPPAEGLLEPQRGFGKAWREHYGGPDGPLGWAVEAEHSQPAAWQLFDNGIIVATSASPGFILYHDIQVWERKDRL